MHVLRSLVVVAAFVVLAIPSVVLADGRVALVVGNSTYAHIGRLPNPDNDARDMSEALRRLGFEVTTEFDADRVELTEALRAFTRQSAAADVSLVFYAGHGIEMDRVNYLVPVDARLERDVDVRYEAVTLENLQASTLGAWPPLVILDVCRNNPLACSMWRTVARRSVSGGTAGRLAPPAAQLKVPCSRRTYSGSRFGIVRFRQTLTSIGISSRLPSMVVWRRACWRCCAARRLTRRPSTVCGLARCSETARRGRSWWSFRRAGSG